MANKNKNTYGQDERLETPFQFKHLLRAGVYIKKYKWKMILAFSMSLLASAAGLMGPKLTQMALDDVIPNKDWKGLWILVGLLVLFSVITVVFATIRSRIMTVVSQNIIYDIRKDLFEHLQELEVQYFDDRPHGKILIRVVNYVNSVADMLTNGLINVILEFMNIIFIVVFMFFMDVKMSLVILCGIPFLAVVILLIKNHQRKAWQNVSNKNSNLNAYLQENITGAKVTKAFTREDYNCEIFTELSGESRKAWMKAIILSNLLWPSVDNISVWVRIAIYVFGLLIFGPSVVSLGTIIAMSSYAARFWQPIMSLANLFNNFINNIAYLERIFETMDTPVSVRDAEDAHEMKEIKGEVIFDDVTFGYEEGQTVLSHVSFKVKAGESVALVGATGAGKSTIVNLISRFYNVTDGRILIDGEDISKVTLKSLRSQMGIMLQDSFLFSGTIADNIRYGRLDATDEQILEASRVVCADDFIKNMPEGYETMVNERGSKLSQGQKQLVSFARTLISDPRILVLDEATSSIDVQTESALQKGLNNMLRGRTSFIIAHRLSTIRNCDKIMFVGDGGILEAGTHEELMAMKGHYYSLYTSQIKEIA
ncbi:MAG: ABC transporter ATP-binding protein [Lachnospiraceae bacterium]|nr:ABC transporter ATP-binding protein [Lachnospiraceae bacterium]